MSNPKYFYDNLIGGGDVLRAYLFKVVIDIQGRSPEQFYFRSATLPAETVDAIVVPRMNSEVKFAGKVKYNDWSVEVIDNTDFQNYNIFRGFQNDVYDVESGEVGKKSGYVGRASVTLLDGSIGRVSDFVLGNLWISSLEPPQVQYGSSELFKFKATFKYDYFFTY